MDNPIIAQIQTECNQFSSIVKNAKKQQGKTIQDIADATGVPVSHLGKYLSGNLSNPNLYNAVAVCKYLGISLDKAFNLRDLEQSNSENCIFELEYLKRDNKHLAEALKNRQMIIAVLLGIITLLITSFSFGVIYDASLSNVGFISNNNIATISIILISVIVIAIITTVIIITLAFRKKE